MQLNFQVQYMSYWKGWHKSQWEEKETSLYFWPKKEKEKKNQNKKKKQPKPSQRRENKSKRGGGSFP